MQVKHHFMTNYMPVPVHTPRMLHVAINLSPACRSISALRWFYRAGLKMWHLLVWPPLESDFHSPAGCNINMINWWGRIVPNSNIKHTLTRLVTHNFLFKSLLKEPRSLCRLFIIAVTEALIAQMESKCTLKKKSLNCLRVKQLQTLSGALKEQFNLRGRK